MYRNLIQAPENEPVFVSAITDPAVVSLLAESGIGEGSEIVKTGEGDAVKSEGLVVEIESCKTGTGLRLTVEEAKEVLVRKCDICWHCGECMIDG